jgi:hypothetical protein
VLLKVRGYVGDDLLFGPGVLHFRRPVFGARENLPSPAFQN